MRPSDVVQIARDQMADPSQNFWGDPELYRYMTMGVNILVSKWPETLGKATATIDATANVANYALPTSTDTTAFGNYLSVNWIAPGKSLADAQNLGIGYRLKKIDARSMYCTQSDSTSMGTPEYYREIDGEKFGVFPTPDSTGYFYVEYTAKNGNYSSTSNFSSDLAPFAHHLPDYILFRAFLKDQELQAQSTIYKQLWDEHLEEIEESLYQTSNSDRIVTIKDEDIFPSTDLGII
jgi:hypothetical protein